MSKNTNSQKSSGMPLLVLEKQLPSTKLLGPVLLNYTRESNPKLVETSRWLTRHRDSLNFINFNNYKTPRIHIPFLRINLRDKLLPARKSQSSRLLLEQPQDILALVRLRHPVSKAKQPQLIRSQSFPQFKINIASRISRT